MDTNTAMQKVGQNCGNLVFQYAVSRLIDESIQVVGSDIPWAPEKVRETARVLVVPSANFLREGFDFSNYVSFLERTELPLLFVGLGAQADDFEKASFDFHPSILRLLDLIRERSPKVSIRGEFTARVLERYGIGNFEITGCPSNFINPAPDFPDMIAAKLASPMRSFITHADEPWPKKAIKKKVECRLVSWTQCGRAIMVQQAVPSMIKYLRQNNPFSTDEVAENFEGSLQKTLMPNDDLEAFREFVAVKLRTYYSVDQWLEDSSHFDFSVGLRLHGNMVAWQSGTPALWITHDSRTRELSDTMALPSIGIEEFLDKCETVQDAWERIDYDPLSYASRRLELSRRMEKVFSAFDIPTNLIT
ncbi:polysaccharide pyruvyl transferase family protein [Ponticoccus litoralis]|uniref:Polysaccharide pyruvyl transferase family protein n=1 Tax=Ponticoccus litoralis TaxID=422297 RepID=A0AAW9SPG2_9RHOB